MRILAIGDVVSTAGCEFLRQVLPNIKKQKHIDMVIANGENSAENNGIVPGSAEHIFKSGVDIITTGNHAFRRKEIYSMFDSSEYIIRPANYPAQTTPGRGFCILDMGKVRVAVINVMGNVYMESLRCPFETVDEILKNIDTNIIIVDFHGEATGEKRAIAYYLDGRISAFFGTHTHVQTSDETILPKGTGYITDAGMTGVIDSVLGVDINIAIEKMKNKVPVRFKFCRGESKIESIIFDIDETKGKCLGVERLRITKDKF